MLDKEPEDQQQLTAVKDRIFHELLGKDGHRYCRTFGASVPRSFVYPHDPLAPSSTSELVQKITEEVTKKLTDQFNYKYDELLRRINLIESHDSRTASPDVQVSVTCFVN